MKEIEILQMINHQKPSDGLFYQNNAI